MSNTSSSVQRVPAREAAAILGVEEQTLAAWRSSGRYGLRYTKVGRLVKYNLSDLEKWLNERSGTSTTQLATA